MAKGLCECHGGFVTLCFVSVGGCRKEVLSFLTPLVRRGKHAGRVLLGMVWWPVEYEAKFAKYLLWLLPLSTASLDVYSGAFVLRSL